MLVRPGAFLFALESILRFEIRRRRRPRLS